MTTGRQPFEQVFSEPSGWRESRLGPCATVCSHAGGDVIGVGDVLLDRYEVTSPIARGGMADVFLAFDRRLQRQVAVKAFRVGGDVARFAAETKLLARLSHRNLVQLFDAGESGGVPFVVLQHVAGPTVAAVLRNGPLSPPRLRRLAVDVASALEYVHALGVVHRDVKPSNVMFETDGRALLGDFGVALLVDATRYTIDGSTLGTAAYLAPEQATGSAVTPAADVYALGLVLIEASSGTPAFTGTLTEIIAAKVSRDPSVDVGVPHSWQPLLRSMTARRPEDRPSATAVMDALRSAEPAPTLVAAPFPVGTEATAVLPPTARNWWRPAIGAAVLVLLLAGLAIVLAGGTETGDGTDAPATTSPTPPSTVTVTVPTTTAPPPPATTATTSAARSCASFIERKEAIERQKKVVESRYEDDEDRLKEELELLEDAKKLVELEKSAAGC